MYLNVALIGVELVGLAILALVLHSWSRKYGLAPLLVFLSGLVGVLHMMGSTHAVVEFGTVRLVVSSLTMVPVILMTILVLYVVEGTATARTAILSIMALSLMVLLIQIGMDLHADLPGGRNLSGTETATLLSFSTWRFTISSILSFAGSLLAIVVVFQTVTNLLPKVPGWLAAGVALLAAMVLDGLIFRLTALGWGTLGNDPVGWLTAKVWSGLLIWPILGVYLTRTAPGLEGYAGTRSRGSLDVIFGSYKAQESNLRLSIERRLKAEKELESTEIRFRASFEQAGAGMVHSDSAGNLLMANRAMCTMVGYTEEELISLGWKAITHPDDLAGNIEDIRSLQEGERDQFETDKRYVKKDGGELWAHVTVSMVKVDADTEERYLIAVIEDLTDRMATDESLRQAQKMEAVGQLTGGIAHDFNNLLTVIMGALELGVAKDAKPEEKREVLGDALTAAKRGASLTQRLLAFSRKQTLKPVPLDVPKTLEGMRELLVRSLGETIKVRIESTDRVRSCMSDQAQFENAILNLCLNARDAMPGGGELLIRSDIVEVKADYLPGPEIEAGEYVQIAVADQGSGIPQKNLEKIFEPFFTTKATGKGSGLGLSMVYGFARQSGGFVTVQSQEGAGTSVQLHLPVA